MELEDEEEIIRITLEDAFPDGPPYVKEIFSSERDYIDALKPGAEMLWKDNAILSVGDPPISDEDAIRIMEQPCLSDARFSQDLYYLMRQEKVSNGAWRIIENASVFGTDSKTGRQIVPPLYRLADPNQSTIYYIRGIARSAWCTSEEFQDQGVDPDTNAQDLIPWGLPVHVSIRMPVLLVDVGTSTDAPVAFTSADGDAIYRIDSIASAHEEELELFRHLRPLAYAIASSAKTEAFARPHSVKEILSPTWKNATLREVWGEVGQSVLSWARGIDSECVNSVCYQRLHRLLEPPLLIRLGSNRTTPNSLDLLRKIRLTVSPTTPALQTVESISERSVKINRKRSWLEIEDDINDETEHKSSMLNSTICRSRPMIDIQGGKLVFKQ